MLFVCNLTLSRTQRYPKQNKTGSIRTGPPPHVGKEIDQCIMETSHTNETLLGLQIYDTRKETSKRK